MLYNMKITSKIPFSILIACMALPVSAQKWKAGEGALKAIRGGIGVVRLTPAVPSAAQTTAARQAATAAARSQYQMAQRTFEQARKNLSAPVTLPKTPQRIEIGGNNSKRIGEMTRRSLAVTAAKRQTEETLYEWGKALEQEHQTALAPKTFLENNQIIFTVNGNKAVIGTPEDAAGQTVITPKDITENAYTLKAILDGYPQDTVNIVTTLFGHPEAGAEFFYLKENFMASWETLHAATDAVDEFIFSSKKSVKELIFGPSKQTKLLQQNYRTASANMAVNMTAMLQFFAKRPSKLFQTSLESHYHIMKLKNQNTNAPSVFLDFWNKPTAI